MPAEVSLFVSEVQQNTFLKYIVQGKQTACVIISITSNWVSEKQSPLEVQISLLHQIERAWIH